MRGQRWIAIGRPDGPLALTDLLAKLSIRMQAESEHDRSASKSAARKMSKRNQDCRPP